MPPRPNTAPARPRWWWYALPAALLFALVASLVVAWQGAGLLLTPHHSMRTSAGVVGPMLQTIVSLRGGIDLASLDQLDQTSAFTMPILLFQGLSDPLVPPSESKQFADKVGAEYVPVARAGHIQSWNVEPKRYENTLTAFLDRVAR